MNNTVLKTLDILRLLSGKKEGIPLSQIAKELELPKSTAFNILRTLVAEDFLSVTGDVNPVYSLGVESLKLGLSYLSKNSLDSVARPILSELSISSNETVFMSVRSGPSHLVYVMKYMSNSEFQTNYSVGAVRSLLSVAMGKAMLSVLPEDEVAAIATPELFRECTLPSVCDLPSLQTYLQQTRELGYVVDATSENPFYAAAVAAPVLDMNGGLVAAISVVIMRDPYNTGRVHELGRAANRAALRISNGLGYLKKSLY